MNDIIIIGAGGLGREVAWLIERININDPQWNLLGFIDDNENLNSKDINGYPVLGRCDNLIKYDNAYVVCAIAATTVRQKIILKIKAINPNIKFATLIDPSVQISELVTLGEGVIICANTVVTVNINIGNHVIINPDCTIGHDAVLESFVTLYPSVNISGSTKISIGAEIGVGSNIIQGKTIGEHAIIGAGSVVVKDIPPSCTAVGVPAKPIKFSK